MSKEAAGVQNGTYGQAKLTLDLEVMTRLHELANLCVRPGNDFQECLDAILDTAMAITGANKGNIQLFDDHHQVLRIASQRGFGKQFLDFFEECTVEHATACATAMRSAGRVIVQDVKSSPIFAGQPSMLVLREEGICAVLSSPLLNNSGNLMGMLSVHFGRSHQPDQRNWRM